MRDSGVGMMHCRRSSTLTVDRRRTYYFSREPLFFLALHSHTMAVDRPRVHRLTTLTIAAKDAILHIDHYHVYLHAKRGSFAI